MKNLPRFAVIGTGVMGNNHARIFSEVAGAELAAIADIDVENGGRLAERYACKFYSDYQEMCDNEKLDGISVCTPTSMHYEIGRNLIERGINILLEKPICDDIDKADELVRLARARKVCLLVGHIERYNPAIVQLKKIIDQQVLGDLITIQTNRLGLLPTRIQDANVVIDLAIHDIDICNYLFQSVPDRVYINCGKAILTGREDHVEIMLHYADKTAMINANWITPVKIRNMRVTGTTGIAELDYIDQRLELYRNDSEKTFNDYQDFLNKFSSAAKEVVAIEKKEPLLLELSHFISVVRDGKHVVDEFAVNALRVAMEYQN